VSWLRFLGEDVLGSVQQAVYEFVALAGEWTADVEFHVARQADALLGGFRG